MKMGYEIDVAVNPDDSATLDLKDSGIRIFPLLINKRLDTSAIGWIMELAAGSKPDIVYATSKESLFHSILALKNHPARLMAYRGIMGNVSFLNPQALFSYSHRRVEKIVCVCEAVRQSMLAAGISPDKPVTIHKGHDITWYQKQPAEILQDVGIPPKAFVLGCVAQMRPRKGIPVLLKALNMLPRHSVHLLLVGLIKDRAISRYIKKYDLGDVVHCAGFRKDAVALGGACTVCVMPSLRREGLPKAVIEAMAHGIPAVVTNVGGLPEIVENGKSGFVLKPNDPGAFAEAIQFFMDRPEDLKTYGKNAAKRIASHFSARNSAEKFDMIFHRNAQ